MPWSSHEIACARRALGITTQEGLGRLGYPLTGRRAAAERTVQRWEAVDPHIRQAAPALAELVLELLLRSGEARAVLGLTLNPAELLPGQRRRLQLDRD